MTAVVEISLEDKNFIPCLIAEIRQSFSFNKTSIGCEIFCFCFEVSGHSVLFCKQRSSRPKNVVFLQFYIDWMTFGSINLQDKDDD